MQCLIRLLSCPNGQEYLNIYKFSNTGVFVCIKLIFNFLNIRSNAPHKGLGAVLSAITFSGEML